MSEVKVCFSPVVGYENFSVLIWTHSARINVYIWIKFLYGNLIASGFEQSSKRSGGYTLTKTGNDASGNKYIFYRHDQTPFNFRFYGQRRAEFSTHAENHAVSFISRKYSGNKNHIISILLLKCKKSNSLLKI